MANRRKAARFAVANAFSTATCYKYPPGSSNTLTTFAYIQSVRDSQEHLAFGGSRNAEMEVTGVIWSLTAGGTDTESEEAADAAQVVFAELETALTTDATLGDATIFHAQLTDSEDSEFEGPSELYAQIEFTVSVEAHI